MAAEASSLGGLNQNQFLTLMLAGLKNQDPFQPMDSENFIQQLSQFATLEGMQKLNASFDEQLKLQQLTNGSALIGREVRFLANGVEGSGRVEALAVQDGKIFLKVGAAQIALGEVTSVAA